MKTIKPEIGKYYESTKSIIRVDKIDKLGTPTGLEVWFSGEDQHSSIGYDVDLEYMFYECEASTDVKEITKQEFDTALQGYKDVMNELFNDLIS